MLGKEEDIINQKETMLQKNSSIFQLTLPYNTKKHSVLILLIQIFYIVTISILICLGFYFLFFSSSSTSSYESELNSIIAQWSSSAMPQFKSLSMEVYSTSNRLVLQQNNSNWYLSPIYSTPLYYYSNNGELLFESSTFNKKYNDILFDSYNLTISIALNISGAIVTIDDIDGIIKTKTSFNKEDCLRYKYVYNEENDVCYQFFTLKSLSLVIDTNLKALVEQYKEFKCNKFIRWYESFKVLRWPFTDTTPGRNQIKSQGAIEIKVLSNADPYVWDSYNKDRFNNRNDNDNSRHFTLGIWMVLIAVGLLLFGLWFYFKEFKEKEAVRIENIKQHHQHYQSHTLQLSDFTESSESDTKVRIPTMYNK